MLNSGGNVDYISRVQFAGRLASFLVITATAGDEQNLSAAFVGMVDVPIIAATGLKGDVADNNLI